MECISRNFIYPSHNSSKVTKCVPFCLVERFSIAIEIIIYGDLEHFNHPSTHPSPKKSLSRATVATNPYLTMHDSEKLSTVNEAWNANLGTTPGVSPLPCLNPIPSWWSKDYSSPLSSEGKEESLPVDLVDVVVIGTGISGISCVLSLVNQITASGTSPSGPAQGKDPFKITVMEARNFCSGATGKSDPIR